MGKVEIHSPGKLAVLGLIVLGCFGIIIANMFTGAGEITAAWATLTAVIGYLIGNGAGALKGQEQQPLLTPKETDDVKYTKQFIGKVIEQVKKESE